MDTPEKIFELNEDNGIDSYFVMREHYYMMIINIQILICAESPYFNTSL